MDKAARDGKAFVRRGTVEASLMRYYATQGFQLIHEVQRKNNLVYLMARRAQRLLEVKRKNNLVYLMARRAQRLLEVKRMFAAGSAVLIS